MTRGELGDADLRVAMVGIAAHDADTRVRATKSLLVNDHPDLENSLLRLTALDNDWSNLELASMATRILVERNPDRNPEFLLKMFSAAERDRETVKHRQRYLSRLLGRLGSHEPAAAFFYFGYPRLRRLDPVQMYGEMLTHGFTGVRVGAALGLGDTADLSALDPLAIALSDSSASVRANAADAVRRLRHSGAAELLATHPVRERLIECMADRRRAVRLAAARALGSMGDVQPIQHARGRLGWWAWRRRRDLDTVLRGGIPPLPKIWAGDETT